MKKTVKIVAIITILAIALVVLVGCGSKLKGKYTIVSMTSGAVTMDETAIRNNGGNPDELYIEFDGDTFKMVAFGTTTEGTYKKEGDKLTLTAEGEDLAATVDGKQIKIEEESMSMTFEKK